VESGRAILRGIKLAAYACAGLLVCLVVYNVISPEAQTPSSAPDSDLFPNERVAAPVVPPPPPLAGQRKTATVVRRTENVQPAPEAPGAGRIREATADEVASAERVDPDVSGPVVAEAPATKKDGEAPVGIVIVRPPVRAPQDNRGMRWIKAMGRALHIGGEKN
jgi:hypothetical protein